MKDVIVKYFSSKSLSTIDMNFFFKVIFDKFGDSNVFFKKMDFRKFNRYTKSKAKRKSTYRKFKRIMEISSRLL